jgi:hypothetical protein
MRFGLGSSLSALLLAFHTVAGYGREAVYAEPVNLHAANAAHAADVAERAANVATRVAAHTEEVAHDTAVALRYTRDALKRAGADKKDIENVGKEAAKIEAEAGIASRKGKDSNLDSSISREYRSNGREGVSSDGGVDRSLDVNSEISPYPNGVEPFGQEDPAKELTKESVKQSDGMVKQIENAQSMEAKRSVYRALTKLRGATIASYDGMAKGHLKNVDNYNKKHKWREEHPMKHLAEEEADTHIWAFPNSKKSTKKIAGSKKPQFQAGPAPAPAAKQ